MAKHGRSVRILFNEFSLSRFLKSADQSSEVGVLDRTVFESTSKEYALDLEDGKMSCEGFWRGAEEDADEFLSAALGSETQSHLLVAPEGYAAVGKRCLMMLCDVVKYAVKGVATNLVMVSAEFQSSSGMNAGVILHALEAETATGNEASHDGGAATAHGAVAQLHIEEASEEGDETLNVIVQHSVDNSVWVDLISFAQASAVGTERKEVTGTVNRYTRARHVVAGTAPSFTFAVGFARLKSSQAA